MKRLSVWASLSVVAAAALLFVLFLSQRATAQVQPPSDNKSTCCGLMTPTSRTIAGPASFTNLLGVGRTSSIILDSPDLINLCATVENTGPATVFVVLSNRAGAMDRGIAVVPGEASAVCGKAARVHVAPFEAGPEVPWSFRWRIDRLE